MDDPGTATAPGQVIQRPTPQLSTLALPLQLTGAAPAPGLYAEGTPEFRFWVASEALARGSGFWSTVVPAGTNWHSTVGPQLTVKLDAGEDLNAFYDRASLQFFHQKVGAQTFFSGESPEVSCHELGHAVLDAVRPQLWNTAFTEVAAFHESFGDISAILSSLQLQVFRQRLLSTTGGNLAQSTRLSRLAEQLGFAIRQMAPTAVDPDCLRNAFNSFFYKDPTTLPPSAPASQLSSEEHSFSRVFTGAFFSGIAGMFGLQPSATDAALLQVSKDAGRLLIAGVGNTPVVSAYYSQVAANILAADVQLFSGKYSPALRPAFVQHGLLAPSATAEIGRVLAQGAVAGGPRGPRAARARPAARRPMAADFVAIPGRPYGLRGDLLVRAPDERARFRVTSADPAAGSVPVTSAHDAAQGYVEDLIRRGQVRGAGVARVVPPDPRRVTHVIVRRPRGLILHRVRIFCP